MKATVVAGVWAGALLLSGAMAIAGLPAAAPWPFAAVGASALAIAAITVALRSAPWALPGALGLSIVSIGLLDPSPTSIAGVLVAASGLTVSIAAYALIAFDLRSRGASGAVPRHATNRIVATTVLAGAAVLVVWWLPRVTASIVSSRWERSIDASSFAFLALWVIALMAVGTALTLVRLAYATGGPKGEDL